MLLFSRRMHQDEDKFRLKIDKETSSEKKKKTGLVYILGTEGKFTVIKNCKPTNQAQIIMVGEQTSVGIFLHKKKQ